MFLKFRNINRKTPALESSGVQLYQKEISIQMFSRQYCETFKDIDLEELLRPGASETRVLSNKLPLFASNYFIVKKAKIIITANQ